jgi:hypothetical protein
VLDAFADKNETSLFEQLRTYLCWGIIQLRLEGKEVPEVTSQVLGRMIQEVFHEANEILTHTFDFLYFYRKDVDLYVKCLWASWSVIPRITHRLSDYLTRCLAAVMSNHLKRPNPAAAAYDQLLNSMALAEGEFPDAIYLGPARMDLEKRKEFYVARSLERLHLVQFVRALLYTPELAGKFNTEPDVSGGKKGGYGFPHLAFDEKIVDNPLRFIEEYVRGSEADPAMSLWMLQHIAFGERE